MFWVLNAEPDKEERLVDCTEATAVELEQLDKPKSEIDDRLQAELGAARVSVTSRTATSRNFKHILTMSCWPSCILIT